MNSVMINPPPTDGKCEACGRPAAELRPFGGTGDPLCGDFTGSLLVKTFRPGAPAGSSSGWLTPDVLDAEGSIDADKFVAKHGKRALESCYFAIQLESTAAASWECRDCIVLEDDGYFLKLGETLKRETEQAAVEEIEANPPSIRPLSERDQPNAKEGG